jgi:uncharacterized membrane protein
LLIVLVLRRRLVADSLLASIKAFRAGRIARNVGWDGGVWASRLARRWQVITTKALLAVSLGQSLLEHAIVISDYC